MKKQVNFQKFMNRRNSPKLNSMTSIKKRLSVMMKDGSLQKILEEKAKERDSNNPVESNTEDKPLP